MPLEWEETRSLSREIKEVMLSVLNVVVCNSKSENATCLFAHLRSRACTCVGGAQLFRKFVVKLFFLIIIIILFYECLNSAVTF